MAFRNKKELLDGINKIIIENLETSSSNLLIREQMSNLAVKAINSLMNVSSEDPSFYDLIQEYYQLFEDPYESKKVINFFNFINQIGQNPNFDEAGQEVVRNLHQFVFDNKESLEILKNIDSFESDEMKEYVEDAFNTFVEEESSEALKELENSIEMASRAGEVSASAIDRILNPEKVFNDVKSVPYINIGMGMNESEEVQLPKKKDAKIISEDRLKKIQESVESYIDEKLQKETQQYSIEDIINQNGIQLKECITRIKNSSAKSNPKLMAILEQYENAVDNRAYEERLYETFISNTINYDYLQPVDTELSALKQRIEKSKENIDLTKMLETMLESNSYYIVPLIEQDVIKYMKEKTPTNRRMLTARLSAFGGDPYIDEMMKILYLDNSKDPMMESKVVSLEDKMKFIREGAYLKDFYSPVLYVKENESLFNIDNTFYKKKGNQILKLEISDIEQLDESFIELSKLVNDPRVQVFEDHFEVHSYDHDAKVFEDRVEIDGISESLSTLRNLNNMCMKYDTYDKDLFIMSSCLLENFNKVAKVDFAKRVCLNEETNLSADIIKCGSNIFITTHNNALHQSIFYRNVNPLQCKHIINEHMGMNVSSLFDKMLPNQDKILLKINESKEKYESQIKELEEVLDKLRGASDIAEGKDADKIKEYKEECETKLQSLKDEYKDWQKRANDYIEGSEDLKDNKKKIIQKDDEPMSKEETEKEKSNLEEPISSSTNTEDANQIANDPTIDDADSAVKFDFNQVLGDENQDTATLDKMDSNEFEDDEDISNESGFVSDEDLLNGFEDEEDYEDIPDASIVEENPDEDVFKVADVLFDKNIVDGKVGSTGEVTAIEKMVDPSGKITNKVYEVTFYLDDQMNPIISNKTGELIPTGLYNMIVDAIKMSSEFSKAEDDTYATDAYVNNGMPTGSSNVDIDPDVAPKKKPSPILDIKANYGFQSIADDPLMTYQDGETEIELPAPNIDGSAIPESLSSKKNSKKLNEDYSIEEESVNLLSAEDIDNFIEDFYAELENSNSTKLEINNDQYLDEVFGLHTYSIWNNLNDDNRGYIFVIDEQAQKISSIALDDYLYQVGEILESNSLNVDDLSSYYDIVSSNMSDTENCINLISSAFSSLTGKIFEVTSDEDLNENIKIKKYKGLSTDFDSSISKEKDDIKYGDKTEKDFEKEKEKVKTKKQDEAIRPKLPNFHVKMNEAISKDFHPLDNVIFNGEPAQVQSCKGDVCVILQNGMTIEVPTSKLTRSSELNLEVPDQFNFDKDNLTRDLSTKPDGKMKDSNSNSLKCSIVMDGFKMNVDECYTSMTEFLKKDNKTIKVINEDGSEEVYDKENVVIEPVPVEEWPYAVIVTGEEDEPSRKIHVDPKSYLEAEDSDDVRCIIADKIAMIPKFKIRILS